MNDSMDQILFAASNVVAGRARPKRKRSTPRRRLMMIREVSSATSMMMMTTRMTKRTQRRKRMSVTSVITWRYFPYENNIWFLIWVGKAIINYKLLSMFGASNGFFGDLNDTWSVEQSGAQERSERQRQELICAQRHMGVCQGAWVELTPQLGKF